MAVSRLPKGVTTVAKRHVLGQFGLPNPIDFHTYFNDWDTYLGSSDWTVTNTGAPTAALQAEDGGVLKITNSAADNDASFFQSKSASFMCDSTKGLWFVARFKTLEATQVDWVMGLQITDTTPLAVSDGIWFQKDDGDTHIDLHIAKASVQKDVTDIAEAVADTYMELGFYYDPRRSRLEYWKDGVRLGGVENFVSTYMPASTTALTVSFGVQNGQAVANAMSVDYLFAAKAR